jgi:hypothetical protein
MRKINRNELIQKIINEAGLPPGKRTVGFFTREQLMELSTWCEKMNAVFEKLIREEKGGEETIAK